MSAGRGEAGQATILLLGLVLAILFGALALGAIARGVGTRNDQQRAADLAALAGARAMHDAFPGLFEPPLLDNRVNAAHLERDDYLALGRGAGLATARRNGAPAVMVSFPDGRSFAPVRVRVEIREASAAGRGERAPAAVFAEAELAPAAELAFGGAGEGEYRGPLAQRQGKSMRPDVAAAFDRLAAAAAADGFALVVASGFRTNAEQAAAFARHPDPRWVAPPGRSLHRLATELDLGPRAAYGWLTANARRFHFIQRYAWEPWHYGFTLNAGTSSVGYGAAPAGGADGRRARGLPAFVPERFALAIARAAQRWNISGALLAAQLYAESGSNPFAPRAGGASGQGHALRQDDPAHAVAAIDARARLMRGLLRRFGAVPLALAAYRGGSAPVAACGCIPADADTRGYVTRILGLLEGAGEATADGGLQVRLVR